LSCVSLVCQAQPLPLKTRHVREAVESGQAAMLERVPASQTLRFDVVLALRNPAELDNFLEELYDSSSPSYRRFVTVQEFTERFGPSQEDYDAVVRFAEANGLKVVGGSRDAMDVQLTGPVSAAERAFHVTMGVYRHPTENRTFYAPDREPTVDLPFELWHISGLDNYSIPRPLARHKDKVVKPAAVLGSCPDGSYCGSDMRAAYYGKATLTGAGQTVGLLEFYGYDIADLQTYFANAGQTNNVPVNGVSAGRMSLDCIDSGKNRCDDREQILDMAQAISMAPGLAAVNVYVGRTDTAILSAMSTHNPLDAQLSSSWTWIPSGPTVDDPYFKKFAAQGQNFFQAAGDSGGYMAGLCIYPGYDAYVTSVGGTDLLTASAGGAWASETAWKYGGGGYCTTDEVAIPSWQQLKGVINSENDGSTTLRNSPDVAAEANYDFYTCADQKACQTGWGGTSFAAPMWAGYLALVNQQAVASGHPRLGFINPILYPLGLGSEYAAAFHDIVSGNNRCCGNFQYWTAVPGFDLATGWGSPNGVGLIEALAPAGGNAPLVSLSPASLKWTTVAVGRTATAKTVTLINSGTATLNISNVAISGNFALKSVSNSCQAGGTVVAGANCAIEVTFTPTKTGVVTGRVTITDNAEGSPHKIALSGTGK
ncbi:MAG: protease pro-enzyme activation domain-containing protein, partial [Terriglobales bacterium]